MKTTLTFLSGIIIASLVFATLTFLKPDCNINQGFSPDKYDWLKIEITNNIKFRTDSWEKRYAITPIIYEDTNVVSVGITTPNGENSITPQEAEVLKPQIESIIQSTLDKYEWAKNYSVEVTVL